MIDSSGLDNGLYGIWCRLIIKFLSCKKKNLKQFKKKLRYREFIVISEDQIISFSKFKKITMQQHNLFWISFRDCYYESSMVFESKALNLIQIRNAMNRQYE